MTVICLGCFCIPIYTVIPAILYLAVQFWSKIKTFLGIQTVDEKQHGGPTAKPHATSKPLNAAESKMRRRRPKNGKPEQFSIPDGVQEVDDPDDWDALLSRCAENDVPIIVEFWGGCCQPCKEIAPYFEELSSQHKDILFAKVNCDEAPTIAARYTVLALPTFVVIKGSEAAEKLQGAQKSKLADLVRRHCA